MTRSIEEHLRRVEHAAAVLRYLADQASRSEEHPDPSVLSGMGDAAGGIEETIQAIRRVPDIDALCMEV